MGNPDFLLILTDASLAELKAAVDEEIPRRDKKWKVEPVFSPQYCIVGHAVQRRGETMARFPSGRRADALDYADWLNSRAA